MTDPITRIVFVVSCEGCGESYYSNEDACPHCGVYNPRMTTKPNFDLAFDGIKKLGDDKNELSWELLRSNERRIIKMKKS